jgi:hypothetical protein
LVRSTAAKLKVVGMLDISGLVTRRWLSPEQSSLDEMIELSNAIVEAGGRCLQMTFHSCTLLPGATPFVRDERQRAEFLSAIEGYLQFCQESGFVFSTVAEQADHLTHAGVDSTATRGAD